MHSFVINAFLLNQNRLIAEKKGNSSHAVHDHHCFFCYKSVMDNIFCPVIGSSSAVGLDNIQVYKVSRIASIYAIAGSSVIALSFTWEIKQVGFIY